MSLKHYYIVKVIEKSFKSIKNKVEYVAHYDFTSVSTFGFYGDSIVEADNSGLKAGAKGRGFISEFPQT